MSWSVTVPTGTGTNFKPCPEGNHAAQIVALVDIGSQRVERSNPKTGERFEVDTRQLVIVVELGETDDAGEPHVLCLRETLSMNSQANLYKIVCGIIGRELKPGESFELPSLLGRFVLANVVHDVTKKGKTIAKIKSLSPAPKGFAQPKWHHKPFAWRVDDLPEACPEHPWLPFIWVDNEMRSIASAASLSCEARGVPPLARNNSNGAKSEHTFNAPTHAQSVGEGGVKTYPPEVDAARIKFGLDVGYTMEELQAKLDDIPAGPYRLLDAHAVPF